MRKLGENLKKLRDAHHWTQKELSVISGVSITYISAIERGERNAGAVTLSKLCEAFAVSEEVLRYGNHRGRYSREDIEMLQRLKDSPHRYACAQELAVLPLDCVPFVVEAIRLMRRYPERRQI